MQNILYQCCCLTSFCSLLPSVCVYLAPALWIAPCVKTSPSPTASWVKLKQHLDVLQHMLLCFLLGCISSIRSLPSYWGGSYYVGPLVALKNKNAALLRLKNKATLCFAALTRWKLNANMPFSIWYQIFTLIPTSRQEKNIFKMSEMPLNPG